ncbi:MAG: condensation domain-containing protein, partial [Gammaproteobacteria bacterium]|nr:condensation domain-containing protein [Gammaproteobacteria bacterium]
TAERFVADPFKAGGRLYRTGDRARYLHNGSLELLGRLDRQIKLRGFRIELGEIEAVLSQQPGISAAAVTVQNAHNDQRLVAYVVPSSAALDTEKLRANIRQVLPDYMIPSLFMQLDALPLTPNGKVDRHRLPAPDWHQAVSAHHVPPRGAVESALAGLYGELLGVTGVGAHDSFFDLGGHSLLATQLVSRIRDALDVELPLRALFDDPTVAGLAKVIQQQSGQAQADKSADQFLGRKNKLLPRSAKYQHAAPASFMQQRLWVLDLLEPGSGVYNLAWALHLGGELNLNVLQNAVNALVRRHQSLRTSMVNADGSPQQVIAEQATISIIAERTSSSGTKALLSQLNARAAVPFDLSDGPLLRVHVLEQGNNDHVLLLVIHHIIADGWSMSVLFNELSQAYNALLSGSSPDWPALPVQYADYSVWQRDWLSGAELERQTKFWQQQLAGAPPRLALPLDRPRPALQSHRGARLSRQLPASLQSGLVDLAREASGTLFMVLVAAFDAVMARYSGSEDIVIGTPVAGRSRTELEGLIGFFVNTLVLRTDLGGNPTFAELIARVRQTALDAYAHQDLPFEKLVDVLNVERDTGVTPVFQVMFNLHNEPVRSISLDDITATPIGIDRGFSKFDMTVSVSETSQGLFVHIEYNSDLFFVETIEGLLDDYTSVLNAVVTDPSVRLSDLLSSDAGGAEAAASPWTEATVAERFATQVVQTPKAIAVRTPRSARSYGALDEQANGIAHALRARVNKSDGYAPRVGLLCRQDLLLPAGMLGILKAGCVWVPLDPSWPQARLQAIAVDAGLTAIVADYPHQSLAASLNVAVVDLDVPARLDAPDVTPNADDLACIIYTSGSTGKPKGVMQTHRGLLLQAMRYSQSLDIQAGDRLSLLSSYAYDAAIQDVFGALLNGATLCPLSVRDGETLAEQTALVKTLVDLSVTVVHATPSLYRYLFGGELTCADDLSAVRRVVLGGEAVRRSDFELYRSRFTAPCQFINGLGLTESTLGVQFCADHETRLLGQSVPIGTAVSGLSVELRDEAGEPGWLGEIVLHGEGLSPGYWGEALRAEPNVLHTGDLGRRLPDGQIVYMGRRDHQVKLRGYRVEPGEVEARINALEGVTDCAVTVVERSGESWLVAYIESAGIAASDATSAPSLAKWRTQLSGQLPGYMVPQSFEGIESLPRLANGKVDYRQLPAPRFGRVLDESLVPARTELESRLQAIWQDVLQVETLGVHDDFFAMGGHSLLATRLIARVRDQLQLEVPLISLFEHPTIAGMAVGLETSGTHQRVPELKSLSRKGRNT